MTDNGYGFLWGDKNVLGLDFGGGCTTLKLLRSFELHPLTV